jgi:hypothetical protein
MLANHISPPEIKILKEGEEVINLWTIDSGYHVVIKNQKGEVFVISISLDENKMPRINQTPNLVITHIDETNVMEVSTVKETSQGKVKVTTFLAEREIVQPEAELTPEIIASLQQKITNSTGI